MVAVGGVKNDADGATLKSSVRDEAPIFDRDLGMGEGEVAFFAGVATSEFSSVSEGVLSA